MKPTWKLDNKTPQSEHVATILIAPASDDNDWGWITINGKRAQEHAQTILHADVYRELWVNECSLICDELADLAGLPKEPQPGWQNCIKLIREKLASKGGNQS